MSTAIGIIGLVLGAIGTGVQFIGAQRAAKASKRAEAARKQQAHLDHLRARRKNIREALKARADTLSVASNQGALHTTPVQGALFQTASRRNQANLSSRQNETLGNTVFDANAQIASAQGLQSFGSGLVSLGGSIGGIQSSPFFSSPSTQTA